MTVPVPVLPKFNSDKFMKAYYRCDNCGGYNQCQCDYPWPTTVFSLDIELAVSNGAVQNGQRYHFADATVTHDPNGWGDDVTMHEGE